MLGFVGDAGTFLRREQQVGLTADRAQFIINRIGGILGRQRCVHVGRLVQALIDQLHALFLPVVAQLLPRGVICHEFQFRVLVFSFGVGG